MSKKQFEGLTDKEGFKIHRGRRFKEVVKIFPSYNIISKKRKLFTLLTLLNWTNSEIQKLGLVKEK